MSYIKERDAMLLLCDVDALIAFHKKHGLPKHSSRKVATIELHKVITAVRTLPIELRRASKQWLIVRGYHSLDDGDV